MKVRCWKFHVSCAPNGVLLASYPTSNWGHDLYICAKCGYVYAVSIELQVYLGPPIEDVIEKKKCSGCQTLLAKSIHIYPDTFVAKDGSLKKWERPFEIPRAEDSLILEFEDLYKDVKRG